MFLASSFAWGFPSLFKSDCDTTLLLWCFILQVLLVTSLRELPWHKSVDSLKFFPRCYLLNEDDKADIIGELFYTFILTSFVTEI